MEVDNVRLLDRFNRKPSVGTLYLTATHLIFVDPEGKKETWVSHMHIGSVEKLALTTSGSPLQIQCKNFMHVTFVIPRDRDCQDIFSSLLKLSQPMLTSGWDFFDLQSEYLRMGVPNEQWALSNINKEYDVCDTYPRYLYTPTGASTHILLGSAKFRSKGRLPVLSYLHAESQAAICRCSQPLSGFSARCVEDESMLQAIRKANPSSQFMYVVDTRPKINAMANRAAGKGYENENFYSNIKFQFVGIENIHVMRSSLQKVMEVCELKNPSMSSYLSGLENSSWLKHIKAVIDTSVFLANAICNGVSVLVHCSDGWDRTAQTCSLACLMLDPYYRTIPGFQVLIEKEWLSFGHKFTDRCGFLGTGDAKEVSPIFTQFLDGVYQLMQQYPRSFQFNERYLLTLHDHVYSCQFGSFIGNCEKDRIDLRLRERTYSLWAYMSKFTTDFSNPFFRKDLEITQRVVIPVTNPQSIRSVITASFSFVISLSIFFTSFWRGLYCRFESGVHPRENITDIVAQLKEHTSSVDDHSRLVEKRISALCRLLGHTEGSLQKALASLSSSESMDFHALLLAEGPANGAPNLRRESDTESGFEDGNSSQLSKSLIEENVDGDDCLQIENILTELMSVATEWRSLRNVKNCSCAMPFEQYTKKHHCWRCGSIYCTRCIDRYMPLSGHDSKRPVPVCKACFKDIKNSPSPSIDDFQKLQADLASCAINKN
ncbi:hypothetical protein CAPTEDRAFT_222026 [Capitella teleta]|uniref:phosphatidylinositol-3,5-bisphosphate 3-phosphatase n=1 Tax=Capitella teleta TaxID=283909 RepID=R7U233_CAPTE|nr:hypothetical protein CAPTEDRAFT_222026 [Capitella teleta]|eukprot:ELU00050.1 hypothetical protein CAPTEDRAFT_222026 [Capitella teleta]